MLTVTALASLLGGCAAPLVVGAAATAGYVGLQSRPASQVAEDTQVKVRIKDRLTQTRFAYLTEIGTDVFYGDVLVTGAVPTAAEADRVIEIIQQTEGVRQVYNELFTNTSISVGQKARDAWIAAQIKPRLLGTEESFPINYQISVVNNHVYIIGEVRTASERNHTLHVLRTTKGVVQVHDYLRLVGADEADKRPNRVQEDSSTGWGRIDNPFTSTGRAPDPLPSE